MPSSINQVSDFTVNTINAIPDTVDQTVSLAAAAPLRIVHGAPVHFNSAINTLGAAPGHLVTLGNTAFTTIQGAPHHALRQAPLVWLD